MLYIIIFVILSYSQANQSQQHSNNTYVEIFKVKIIDTNTMSLLLAENPNVVIIFVQQNCPHSENFIQEELIKIKQESDKFNITFALYDSGIYDSDSDKINQLDMYGIVETPTIFIFLNEVPHIYTGIKKSHLVFEWIQQFFKGNPPPSEIFSQSEFNQLQQDNKNILFYQKNSSSNFDINFDLFYQFAIQNTNLDLAFIYSQQYQKNNLFSLKFYKKETQEEFSFNYQLTLENIKKFILKHSHPSILQLNSETEILVFQANSLSIILFYGLDELSKTTESFFQVVANSFNNSYQFSKINIQDEQYLEYLTDLGVNDGIIPKIVAINGKFKYKYDGQDFSVNGIKSFIFSIKQGKLSSYKLSEPIPDYNHTNSYVKNIVGLNYDDEIKKNNKNILLKYHVKGCQHCIELEPIYEEIAYNYRENDNLLIAQIDIRLNDFTDLYYPRQTPDIILFLQKQGKRKAIFWNQLEMTYENIENFVKVNIKQEKK